jgi:hypothetical protein
MSFHLLGYMGSIAAGAPDADLPAIADPEFSRRNNHYIFTEDYWALAFAHLAQSALRARLNVPTINAVARHIIWPVNRTLTTSSHHRIQDLRTYPLKLPLNEEIAVEVSNNAGVAEPHNVFIWVAPSGWTRNIPRGILRLTVRASASVALTASAWTPDSNIVFAENLRGGWYSVVGAYCISTLARGFRLNFVRMPMINGRKFRPGSLVTAAVGNLEEPFVDAPFGEWGRFHTFEPPQLQMLADSSVADTQELRLDLVYLGEQGRI